MDDRDTEEENDRNKIFAQYEDKSKIFEKIIAVLIGFGVFFFFTAFWQYFSIQFEIAKLLSDIREIETNIASVNQQINDTSQQELKVQNDITNNEDSLRQINSDMEAIGKSLNGVDNLMQNITISRENLRNFIRSISDDDVVLSKCGNRFETSESEWINCNVNATVNEYILKYEEIIKQDIVTPIETLSNESGSLVKPGVLLERSQNLVKVFKESYRQNPNFWVTIEGKGRFFQDISDEADRTWNQGVDNITGVLNIGLTNLENKQGTLQEDLNLKVSNKQDLGKQLTKLRQDLGSLSGTNQTLTNNLALSQTKERDLTEKWKEIQSPFGSVPIELKEIIALFPLSLAAGFLVCSHLLTDSIRLRRSIHYSYLTKNSNPSVVNELKIAYVAPLWIDPSNPEKNNPLRIVILSVPLIIFIFSLIMIFYVWYYAPTVMTELAKLVYSGLYAISIGFFVYGYLLIKKELDYYSRKLPKSSKYRVNKVIEGNTRNLVTNRKISLEQAESLLQKLSDYRHFLDSGDFSKANDKIDEFTEEARQMGTTLKIEEEVQVLIEEANRLKIDHPTAKGKAESAG
jgi:hypothetical protein